MTGVYNAVTLVLGLSDADLAFLDALRAGETANGYARRNHYSESWAKKKSRRIKDLLGATTIGEALAMSDLAGIERGLADLGRKFDDALKALQAAATPAATSAATDTIRDLREELRLRGLTEKDLDEAAARKRDEAIDARVQAALDARDAAAAAAAGSEEDDDDEDVSDARSLGDRVLDGLGGIRNVKPS